MESSAVDSNPTRDALKADFFHYLDALDPQQALLPFASDLTDTLDQLILQLEALNPNPFPLRSPHQLEGTWQLIYASQGTVVTRRLVDPVDSPVNSAVDSPASSSSQESTASPNLWGGIQIQRIWQTLTECSVSMGNPAQSIRTENGAVLAVPGIGQLELRAEGDWTWDEAAIAKLDNRSVGETAMVTFDAFACRATHLFGQSDWDWPELRIPILAWLRNQATWTTSYLDETLRVGRGATGNCFVFRKENGGTGTG